VAGLYFHIPFRTARRSFDDAYYEVIPDADRRERAMERFTAAMQQELRLYAKEHAEDEPIRTIQAGGGRPSLLPIRHVRSLVTTVLDVFDASAFQQSTAELNPADGSKAYLDGLRTLGFNRLSIAALSFYPDDLKRLQTPHTAADAIRCIRAAHDAGFETIAVDLAFGWPGQSIERWENNLQQAVDMEIPSVTVVEWHPGRHAPSGKAPNGKTPNGKTPNGKTPNGKTPNGKAPDGKAPDGDDEERLRMKHARQFKLANELLGEAGYEPYELTHFAQPGHEALHLQNTYDHGSYIGVGPSAESFWWPNRSPSRSATRWTNVSNLDRYIQLLNGQYSPIAYRQTADWTSLTREYIFLRLRTTRGLDLTDLNERYGYDLRAERERLLDTLADNNLVHSPDNKTLRLTPSGRLVADGIAERLMPE
jgi:oxygen-independent coproporphyrinogen-3 oxidase